MHKPLAYIDSDLAIACLVRKMRTVGLTHRTGALQNFTVSDPVSVQYAERLVASLPAASAIEQDRAGVLVVLATAAKTGPTSLFVQVPVDFD